MSTAPEDQPTEAARVVARLARVVLSQEDAMDLRQALGHLLAAPGPGAVREARIGLLLDLVREGTAEIPNVQKYEVARQERLADGEEWPSHSMLIRAYGHWLAAVKAAMRLHFEGTPARVPLSYQHSKHHATYTREEVVLAIRRCSASLGSWPTQWEYEEWAALTRKAARHAGRPDPRVPVLKPIRRSFGTFSLALAAAKRLSAE